MPSASFSDQWRAEIWISAFLLAASALQGVEFEAWVTDAVTGTPVEGAHVTLDAAPADGRPEYSSVTPIVGFTQLSGIAAGAYVLSIARPGYEPIQESLVAGGSAIRRTFKLTPAPGGPGFDLLAQVNDVTTGLQLPDVAVTVFRFEHSGDRVPAGMFAGTTDTNGFLVFRSMTNGYYRLAANGETNQAYRQGWEAFYPQVLTNLDRTYMANILLKPVRQDLAVKVVGFDPVLQRVGPLSDFTVELTGLDPRDTNRVAVPVRNAPTDAQGSITFPSLPSVAWRVRTKHLGYDPAEQTLYPEASGLLPGGTVTLRPEFQTNELGITLTSPYNPQQRLLLYNVPVSVHGLKGTGTEGVERVLNSTSLLDPPDQRSTTNLPPGRYLVSVSGMATTNKFYPLRPYFRGEDYVEVLPGRTIDLTLPLEAAPAIVQAQLFAADGLSDVDINNPVTGVEAREPIYQLKAARGIAFLEYAPDRLLVTNQNTFATDTDAEGQFSFSLLPARYGLRIASMTNYWGSHLVVHDLTAGTVFAQGWPFATNWPYTGQPPANGTTNAGLPLVFLPNHNYQLEVFVRRKTASLRETLTSDFSLPTRLRVLSIWDTDPRNQDSDLNLFLFFNELSFGESTATLSTADGGVQTAPITNILYSAYTSPAQIDFNGLTSGTNTLTVSTPRQTFHFYDPDTGAYSASSRVAVLPAWTPPGVLPPSNPNLFGYVAPLTVVTDSVGGSSLHDPSDKTITWQVRYWQASFGLTNYSAPETIDTPDRLSFVAPDYAGGKVFAYRYLLPGSAGFAGFHPPFPQGGFTYWLQFGASQWFVKHVPEPGDYSEEVYVGGPSNNCTGSAPAPTYNLVLDSVSADDPTFLVPGTVFRFTSNPNDPPYLMNGQTLNGLTNSLSGAVVQNANWQFIGLGTDFPDPVTPVIRLTAKMRRGIAFRGTITNSLTSQPVGYAQIRALDRYGGSLLTLTNDPNGNFASPAALPASQTLFVQIDAPGFKTWRQRFTPGDTLVVTNDPLNSVLVINANLEPVPPPQILDATLNRYGKFLPGVSRAGNQSAFDGFSAAAALTLTWGSTVQAQVITNTLPAFDLADGRLGGVVSETVLDSISEVWFIDPRSFASNPYSESPSPVLPPLSDDPHELGAWLAAIGSGDYPNVFYQRVSQFTLAPTNHVTATNQVPLWKLPPGVLKPLWAVVTRSGAVAIKENYQYPAPVELHQLEGVALPPWLASAADIIGVTAGLQPAAEQLEKVVPIGHFLPLPTFTAAIATNLGGFLDYDYTMSVQWEEGADTPDSGLLALAPSVLGINFEGQLQFGLTGEAGQVYLRSKQDTHGDQNVQRFVPKWAARAVKAEGSWYATTQKTVAQTFPGAGEDELELTNLVGGGFSVDIQANLAPITSKLPYIGPVLLALDKTETLQTFALFGGSAGLSARSVWRTRFPPAFPLTDPDPNVLRRHFLGGSEPTASTDLGLCFSFYAGLSLSALGDHLGAEGHLRLTGEDCPGSGAPAVHIDLNPSSTWPLVKHISGSIKADLEAHLKVWVVQVGANYEWELITFDHEFGTEPEFHLIPLDRGYELLQPNNAPPVRMITNAPAAHGGTVLTDLFPAGSVAAASDRSGCALLFTDTDPSTGDTLLKFSLLTAQQTLAPPATVTSAGAIVDSALVRLPSGQWLAAWSEIASTNRLDPFCPSAVKSSLADPTGQTWSTPALVASLDDMANSLKLVSGPTMTNVVFSHTADGPLSETYSLSASTWDGNRWTPLTTLLTNEPLASFSVSANSGTNLPAGLVACVEANGSAVSFAWQGTNFAASEIISSGAGRHLSLAPGLEGQFRLALETADGNIDLLELDSASRWTDLATVATNALPSKLELGLLETAAEPRFVLVWIPGADPANLDGAALDADGHVLNILENLGPAAGGTYRDVTVLSGCGGQPEIVARYSTTNDSVQVLQVSFNQPLELARPALAPDGTFEFDLSGPVGLTYRLQSSSNLVDWLDFATLTLTNSPSRIGSVGGTSQPARFYRAIGP